MNEDGEHQAFNGQKWFVPAILVVCVLIVGFWEIMANITRNPFRQFDLTAEYFKGFSPSTNGWIFQPVPINSSSSEPNILMFKVVPSFNLHSNSHILTKSTTPILVRLVHGYNMPDCMRIKGYKVELIEDNRRRGIEDGRIEAQMTVDKHECKNQENGSQNAETRIQKTKKNVSNSESGTQNSELQARNADLFYQIWRLTSGSGDVSIWITSMIRSGDFILTDMDVRSMPFPRIGVPDDPRWFPRGFSWSSLRHPVKELMLFMRAKWNASRCDIATFLRLKTPEWVSGEYLTLVSTYEGPSVMPQEENVVVMQVASAHGIMLAELHEWPKNN